ncbi:LytR/AlgR family response regulator transcription factor [Aliiglaciecola sp. M165]|uniref:LytR/AlgR family response regulator transcription factor n=1 Tax=Aliiglaciecola sp. M165 TaxID=2593649 RepID=UPI00117C8C8B|nr:response regulator transcription factor [Aliiglaciecola sp. M165]TRY33297.1 response regulator transcription factor [Aliiglaciecola sp. M165]
MSTQNLSQVPQPNRRVRTLVVDDEPLARDLISGLVSRDPDLDLVGVAACGSEALSAIERYAPDLLLLDIQMPNLDGVSIAEQLLGMASTPYIVFITAHDEYAIQAFEVSVRDYIVKPVSKTRFAASMSRAKKAICAEIIEKPKPLIIKSGETLSSVLPNDVVWVSAANQYVCLHTAQKREFVIAKSLRQFSRDLPEKVFTRIHRSTLINKSHLKSVYKGEGCYIVEMSDGSQHKIARNRKYVVADLLATTGSQIQ